MWLVELLPLLLHAMLAGLTQAVPQGFYNALDFVFAVPRNLNGTFPFMISLTQALVIIFYAWIAKKIWTIFTSLSSYAPKWLLGQGRTTSEIE